MAKTIQSTTNYNQFNKLVGNREIHEGHVQNLVISMQKYYMPVPIVVNSKMEVVEGQHRIEACKRLNLPVYYIIDENANLQDVHELNKYRRSWSTLDFLQSKNTQYVINKDEKYQWHHECYELWKSSNIRWQRYYYLMGSHATKISSLDQEMHSLPNLSVVKKCMQIYYDIQVMADANGLLNGKVLRSLYSVIKMHKIASDDKAITHLIKRFNDYGASPKFFGKKMTSQKEAVETWIALYNYNLNKSKHIFM